MKFKNTKFSQYLMIFCLSLSIGLNAAGTVLVSQKSPHATLGITKGASREEIKRAYHRLARQWHPDKYSAEAGHTIDDATATFSAITEAYKTLNEEAPLPATDTPEEDAEAAAQEILKRYLAGPIKRKKPATRPAPARSTRSTESLPNRAERTYSTSSDIVKIFIDRKQYILIGSNGKVYYPATILDENGIEIPATPDDHENKSDSFSPLELNPYEKHAVFVRILRAGVLYQTILKHLKIVIKGVHIKDLNHPQFKVVTRSLSGAFSEVLGHDVQNAHLVDVAVEEISQGTKSSFSKKHPAFELDVRKRLEQHKRLLIKQKRSADAAGDQGYTSQNLREEINRINEYLSA